MLRLAIARNLQILPKNVAAFTSNAVNGLTNRLNQTTSVAINNNHHHRLFSLSSIRLCDNQSEEEGEEGGETAVDNNHGLDPAMLTNRYYKPRFDRRFKRLVGTDRDRTVQVPLDVSIEYLKSDAYKSTYGDEPVWVPYRRVHKGQLPKFLTRRTCIKKYHKYRLVWTSSPCPICRDEYLVLHEQNVDLLKQFISPATGEILCFSKTNLCRRQHYELQLAVERAFDKGLLEMNVPFREYDYADYYDIDARTNIINLNKSKGF